MMLPSKVSRMLRLQLREACQQRDQKSCQGLLEQVKQSFTVLKGKLEIFLQLEQKMKQLQST